MKRSNLGRASERTKHLLQYKPGQSRGRYKHFYNQLASLALKPKHILDDLHSALIATIIFIITRTKHDTRKKGNLYRFLCQIIHKLIKKLLWQNFCRVQTLFEISPLLPPWSTHFLIGGQWHLCPTNAHWCSLSFEDGPLFVCSLAAHFSANTKTNWSSWCNFSVFSCVDLFMNAYTVLSILRAFN